MSNIDNGTRILNIDDRDSNWIKILFDPYIPAPVGGYTKGLISSLQEFYNLYALNPANIREGFDFAGTVGNIYQVKVSEDDLQGYLGDKITVSNGLTLTINGSSNEVINFALDIQESDVTNGVSLLNNSFTIKQIIAGDHISLVESDESITIVVEDISSEDVSVQPDESLNGVLINQKEVNEEVVENIENIYSLLQGQSPAYGDLIGSPLPQAIPATASVATWSTVNQSSDLDIWEFNDTLNEILVKKAGFYTWNTQVSLDNGANQDRYLIFSTRDKNATGTIFYTRSILVPRNGTTSQTSIQFEVPTDNTTIEIVAHGETSTGVGSNDLTLTNWDTSFTLNFVLEPEVELGTNVITVFDSINESLSGIATKQNGINEENKIAIQNIEDDYLKLDGSSEMTGGLNMGANFIYDVGNVFSFNYTNTSSSISMYSEDATTPNTITSNGYTRIAMYGNTSGGYYTSLIGDVNLDNGALTVTKEDTDGNQLILKNKYISYGDVSINFRNGEGSGSVDTTAGQQLFGINQRMEGYGKTVKAMVWEYANDELGTTNELMRIDQSGDLFVGGDITTSGTINYAKSVRVEEYYNGSLSTPRYYKLAQLPSPSASGNGDVHISGTLGTHTGNHSNINVNISTRDGLKFNGTLFGKNAYANDIYIDSSYGVWLRGYSYFLSNIVVSTTGSMTTLDYDGSYTTTAPSGLTKISNTTETGSWWAGSTTKNTF